MTNPGDSDEWWKKYSGEGVSPDSGAQGSVPQYPTSPPPGYPSTPQYPQQPPQQSGPQYQQPQYQQPPQYQQSYPSQPYPQQQTGYPYPPGYQPYNAPLPGNNSLAIAAMVSSLIGVCTCGVASIAGIVMGVMALNQINERPQEGRGMALAGIWIGVASIVLWALYWVLVLIGSV